MLPKVSLEALPTSEVSIPFQWRSPPIITPELPPASLHDVKPSAIKTQKARGYKMLGSRSFSNMERPYLQSSYILPQNIPWLRGHSGVISGSTPWFARPCPVTPRHGFVESREVHDFNEACDVLAEARAVDPDAEVLLVRKLSGKYSGIATNMGVTWGLGNDGVTGSKGNTFLIPSPPSEPAVWNGMFTTWGYADIKEVGYVELVESNGDVQAVQFRDGPQLPATRDFIPAKVKVKEVLWERPDLMEWETLIKSKQHTKGLVVQLKKGTALSAHAAVHAIALGIPAVGSHHVEVGEILKPGADQPKRLTVMDYNTLNDQMIMWSNDRQNEDKYNRILTAIASVHAMSVWDNSPHLINLRAFAIPALIRFLAAASHGELRHWWNNGPGRYVADQPTTPFTHPEAEGSMRGLVRGQVYDEVFRFSFGRIERNLKTLVVDYGHKDWGQRRKPYNTLTSEMKRQWRKDHRKQFAYGGPNWANVAQVTLNLVNAYFAFQTQPNSVTWGEVIIAANNAIHTAHNGGLALSKWIHDEDFHNVAKSPGWGFTNNVAATIVLGKRNELGVSI